MQIEKNIAAMLQLRMEATGKTKLELSKELGIPRSTFQGYLKGDKSLRSDSIEELAKSLDISPAQLISGPSYTDDGSLLGMEPPFAEFRTLHPQAQQLAQEALSLLQTAYRISDALNCLDEARAGEKPAEDSYRYALYESHGAARALYAYGILGQQKLESGWTTVVIAAPFSNNRPEASRLARICTERQLEPIHILDVVHDFMDMEARMG